MYFFMSLPLIPKELSQSNEKVPSSFYLTCFSRSFLSFFVGLRLFFKPAFTGFIIVFLSDNIFLRFEVLEVSVEPLGPT